MFQTQDMAGHGNSMEIIADSAKTDLFLPPLGLYNAGRGHGEGDMGTRPEVLFVTAANQHTAELST
jgi:hypothetical protein